MFQKLMMITLSLGMGVFALLAAGEFQTVSGEKVRFDTIDFDPSTPRMALGVKHEKSIRMLTLNEVDITTLPTDLQEQFAAYAAEQKKEGRVLYQDQWVDRNEMLLKTDKQFGYEKRLRKGGRNVLTVVNDRDVKVTIGLRFKNQGTEYSIEAGETKKLRYIPDGLYQVFSVYESPDEPVLVVMKEDNMRLQHHHMTLTFASGKGGTGKLMGTIPIPAAMR